LFEELSRTGDGVLHDLVVKHGVPFMVAIEAAAV
jgi:hypothetical protein